MAKLLSIAKVFKVVWLINTKNKRWNFQVESMMRPSLAFPALMRQRRFGKDSKKYMHHD
jgi:hypothetical protein